MKDAYEPGAVLASGAVFFISAVFAAVCHPSVKVKWKAYAVRGKQPVVNNGSGVGRGIGG